jgi:hypothetical protein
MIPLSEPTLQISENVTLSTASTACHEQRGLGFGGASFIYKLYRAVNRTESCGILACIVLGT